MPRSNHPDDYGPEYEQLLLRAYTHLQSHPGQDFTIQLEAPNVSASLKAKVYAYLRSLRKENARQDLIAMAGTLSLRCAGCAIVFFRREDSWDARALRDALGLGEDFTKDAAEARGVVIPPRPQAVESPHEKLMRIRKQEAK